MKFFFIISLFLAFYNIASAQSKILLKNYTICSIEGEISLTEVSVSAPNPDILQTFTEILAYAPFPTDFYLYRTRNLSSKIFAAIEEETQQRIIVYDEDYLKRLATQHHERWAILFAMAHEIGHHVAEHTLKTIHLKKDELIADYFAGYVLRKMGAEKSEILQAINDLAIQPNDETHPDKSEREIAVLNGWEKASTGTTPPPCQNYNTATLLIKNNTNKPIFVVGFVSGGFTTPSFDKQLNITIPALATEVINTAPVGNNWSLKYRAMISNTDREFWGDMIYKPVLIKACSPNNRINID